MKTLKHIQAELDLHFQRVDQLILQMKKMIPFQDDFFQDIENIKTIDSFIYRFSKIQDTMGSKFFPVVLKELQEDQEGMALLDMLHKLEKLNLLENSDHWIDYRKLRNQLTHEYPNNHDEILNAVTLAIKVYEKMKKIYLMMLNRVESREKLL